MTRHNFTDHSLCHRHSRHDGNERCWVRSLRMRQFRHGARDDDPCPRTIKCAREWTAAHTAPSGHRSPPRSKADEQRAGRRRQRGKCPQRTRQISTEADCHTSHHTHTHTVTHTHTHTCTRTHTLGHTPRARIATHAHTHAHTITTFDHPHQELLLYDTHAVHAHRTGCLALYFTVRRPMSQPLTPVTSGDRHRRQRT
jgi:hypothetical protein